MKEVQRQVVGKVELGQVVAYLAQALFPLRCGFFHQRIGQPFAPLRKHRLFAHLLLKALPGDHAPAVEFIAHAMADVSRQHRVLHDLQVNGQDAGRFIRQFDMVKSVSA